MVPNTTTPSEEMLIALFSKSELAVAFQRIDGSLTFANEKLCSVLKTAPDRLAGQGWRAFLTPDKRDRTIELWQQGLLSKRAFQLEIEWSTDAGLVHTVTIFDPLPLSDGDLLYHSHFLDLTERYKAEQDLKLSEERFRKVFDQQLQFAAILSPEGTVIDINEVPLTQQGFRKSDFVGKPFWDSPSFLNLPQVRENIKRRIEIVPLANEPLEVVDEFRNKDGSHRYVRATYSCVFSETGTLLYLLIQASDITQQLEFQERLAEYRESLEKSNDRLVEEKKAAKALAAELTRSNQELEQFAYVASHDLQEPLRMVSSYVELLSSKMEGKLDQKTVRYMGYIVEGARRLQALINDLLLVSRINRQGRPPSPTDATEVINEVQSLLQSAIQESQASIAVDDLPTVLVDRTQLRQVFQNLISNSLKYRGDTPPKIRVSAHQEKSTWRFRVEDNGIGIQEQHHDRVFLIFQRLHRRDEFSGSGIGLALVKKIIERHGGEVGIESNSEQGCTVWFTLPDPSTITADEDL